MWSIIFLLIVSGAVSFAFFFASDSPDRLQASDIWLREPDLSDLPADNLSSNSSAYNSNVILPFSRYFCTDASNNYDLKRDLSDRLFGHLFTSAIPALILQILCVYHMQGTLYQAEMISYRWLCIVMSAVAVMIISVLALFIYSNTFAVPKFRRTSKDLIKEFKQQFPGPDYPYGIREHQALSNFVVGKYISYLMDIEDTLAFRRIIHIALCIVMVLSAVIIYFI